MRYLKKHNELFGFPKKKEEVKFIRPDLDVLKEILHSELDGVRYRSNDCSEFELDPFYYKSDQNGQPVIKKTKYFEAPIQYTKAGNSNNFHEVQLGYLLNLDKVDDNYDIYEAFMLQNKVFEKINKDRLREYNIGCCFVKMSDISYKILFYSI